ncbi:tryptophan synthase subunit alpha [Enterococcus gilvus]|uniref:tryptophan synthase subunit alpha n=1 Tax=Enterococcus gilvus TaxID=160453 RepID=UPI0028D4568A|nr:tryptophan synthase subunit alpha [Enterococcus gilvus]
MKNLVLYVTFGYPTKQKFFEILDTVEKFNVGYVELGIPVFDPYLDGTTVKESQAKVLSDLSTEKIASMLSEIRERYSFKIILMTYSEGVEQFNLRRLSKNLYDALLCVDKVLDRRDFSGFVHIFNHTMSKAEIDSKLSQSAQFIYLVSGEGKTGEFAHLPSEYTELLPYVKKNTALPVFVGFGVKSPEDILSILKNGADGAIIGSEFINRYNKEGITGIESYLSEIQTAY